MNYQTEEQARDEVFRKIGRNVVNFQKIERLLKALVKTSGFHGKASEIEARVKKQNESVEVRSMGNLVGSLFDSVGNNSSGAGPPDDLDESWISMKFETELEKEDADGLKEALAEIVEQRNKLIHQQLTSVNFNSVESCNELGAQLDLQREKLKPQFNRLRSFLKSTIESRALLVEFMDTEEFRVFFVGE